VRLMQTIERLVLPHPRSTSRCPPVSPAAPESNLLGDIRYVPGNERRVRETLRLIFKTPKCVSMCVGVTPDAHNL